MTTGNNKPKIGMLLIIGIAFVVYALYFNSPNQLIEDQTDSVAPESNGMKESGQAGEQWKHIDADSLSAEEILKYLHFTNHSACKVAYDFGGKIHKNQGRTGIDGQKTVCMDEGLVPVPGNCLIYSIGINNEWSFDKMFEDFGCRVYAFDPSMTMADGDYTPNIHFFRMGISDQDTDQGPSGWKLRSLSSVYEMLKPKHGPNAVIDYLKMDVEGAEWRSIPQMMRSGIFDKIKQLGVEFHFESGSSLKDYQSKIKVLKSLEDYGMVRFSSRVNIWMAGHINMLNGVDNFGYEITWYNQKFKK